MLILLTHIMMFAIEIVKLAQMLVERLPALGFM